MPTYRSSESCPPKQHNSFITASAKSQHYVVARVLAAAWVLAQDAALDEVDDIPVRGYDRAFADGRPLLCSQVALESIEEAVQHLLLSLLEGLAVELLPELRLS